MKTIIHELTSIANSLDSGDTSNLSIELDKISSNILNTLTRSYHWQKYASTNTQLAFTLYQDLTQACEDLFTLSNKIIRAGRVEEADRITRSAQGFWNAVKGIGKGIAAPVKEYLNLNKEDVQANQQRKELYANLNNFVGPILTSLYNQVTQIQEDQIPPEQITNIDGVIQQEIQYLQGEFAKAPNQEHPCHFLSKQMIQALSKWQPGQINKEQLMQNLKEMNNMMRQAEMQATQLQERAVSQYNEQGMSINQNQQSYQISTDKLQELLGKFEGNEEAQRTIMESIGGRA